MSHFHARIQGSHGGEAQREGSASGGVVALVQGPGGAVITRAYHQGGEDRVSITFESRGGNDSMNAVLYDGPLAPGHYHEARRSIRLR